MQSPALCACGRPLHYSHAGTLRLMAAIVRALGPLIEVEVEGQGRWRVPRHYIALHGLRAVEVPELAQRYHWEKVA